MSAESAEPRLELPVGTVVKAKDGRRSWTTLGTPRFLRPCGCLLCVSGSRGPKALFVVSALYEGPGGSRTVELVLDDGGAHS